MNNQKYKLVQVEPVAWHPIDTVPKDGTNVLLWTPAGIIEAHYRKCLYCDYWWHDWQISVVDAYSEHASLESQPTHWMPLLDAPGAPAVQGEPVAFDEDAALSLAERVFYTEIDEQLAADIVRYARRLHTLYTALAAHRKGAQP